MSKNLDQKEYTSISLRDGGSNYVHPELFQRVARKAWDEVFSKVDHTEYGLRQLVEEDCMRWVSHQWQVDGTLYEHHLSAVSDVDWTLAYNSPISYTKEELFEDLWKGFLDFLVRSRDKQAHTKSALMKILIDYYILKV